MQQWWLLYKGDNSIAATAGFDTVNNNHDPNFSNSVKCSNNYDDDDGSSLTTAIWNDDGSEGDNGNSKNKIIDKDNNSINNDIYTDNRLKMMFKMI